MKPIKKIIIGISGLLLFATILLPNLPVGYSQDQPTCPSFTVTQIQTAKQDFYTNLQKIVSDATPASSNTTLAFDLYRDYLSTLTNIFQDNAENIGDTGGVLTTPQTIACQRIISTDKAVVQETLEGILKSSISGKQSFNLTEKYSQINQKFRDLNQETNQVSKKIKDFSQQLPCYSRACVQD